MPRCQRAGASSRLPARLCARRVLAVDGRRATPSGRAGRRPFRSSAGRAVRRRVRGAGGRLVLVLDAALRRPVRALRAAAAAGGASAWPAAHPAADGRAVFFVRMDPGGYVLGIERPRPSGPSGRWARTCSTRPSLPAYRGWAEVAAAGGSRIVRFSPRAASYPLPRCRRRSRMPERRSSPPMAAGSGSSEQNAGGATFGCSSAPPARSDPSRAPIGTCSISGSSRTIGWCSPDGGARRLACSSSGPAPAAVVAHAAGGVGPADAQPGRFARRTLARLRRARSRKLAALASVAGSGRAAGG